MKVYRVLSYRDGHWNAGIERFESFGVAQSIATGRSAAGIPSTVKDEEIPDPPSATRAPADGGKP